MGQRITFWATNEDLRNLERLKTRWPRWGTAQLLHKALAIAALVLDENDEHLSCTCPVLGRAVQDKCRTGTGYRADKVESGPPEEVREVSSFEQAVQELFGAQA